MSSHVHVHVHPMYMYMDAAKSFVLEPVCQLEEFPAVGFVLSGS